MIQEGLHSVGLLREWNALEKMINANYNYPSTTIIFLFLIPLLVGVCGVIERGAFGCCCAVLVIVFLNNLPLSRRVWSLRRPRLLFSASLTPSVGSSPDLVRRSRCDAQDGRRLRQPEHQEGSRSSYPPNCRTVCNPYDSCDCSRGSVW